MILRVNLLAIIPAIRGVHPVTKRDATEILSRFSRRIFIVKKKEKNLLSAITFDYNHSGGSFHNIFTTRERDNYVGLVCLCVCCTMSNKLAFRTDRTAREFLLELYLVIKKFSFFFYQRAK